MVPSRKEARGLVCCAVQFVWEITALQVERLVVLQKGLSLFFYVNTQAALWIPTLKKQETLSSHFHAKIKQTLFYCEVVMGK